MSELPDFEQFCRCVDETFELRLREDAALPAQLIEAKSLGASAPGRREAFSLLFRTADARVLPQQLYHLDHPRLGRLQLFLVPIGPDAGGMRYEAIFN